MRHGRTEWSATGRHTGLTDVPLDAEGEQAARALGELLQAYRFEQVRTSPLQRARRTAELAGLAPLVEDQDLVEWDYGAYEGLSTPQVRAMRGDDWRVFDQGVAPGGPGQTPGENIHEVADRARSVLGRVRQPLARGPVALIGHGHFLRVLATAWLGLPPDTGAMLELGTGSVSVLTTAHGIPAIALWNQRVPLGG